MDKIRRTLFRGFLWVLLGVFSVSVSGCEPLRKKFIRQKKKDKDEAQFEPVLEPIDYPRSQYTVKKDFAHRYGMWNVWHREYRALVDEAAIIRDGSTKKRETYIVRQMVMQIEEMQALVNSQKQQELELIKRRLLELTETMNLPVKMWSSLSIKSKLGRIDKDFRHNFNPKKMEAYLVESR